MAERQASTKAGSLICAYDALTNKDEVLVTLRRLVKEDADGRHVRQIYIISSTHGNSDGSVDPEDAEVEFKAEDLQSAGITRTNVNVRDYHQTGKNRWAELRQKTDAVLVLAWCYSLQWLGNPTDSGNNGKIAI